MVEHVRRFVGSMFITRYFGEWARMRKSDSMQTQSLFFFHVHRLSGDLWLRVVLSSVDLWWRSLQSGIDVHKMVYKHADAPSVNPVLMEGSTNHRSTSSCTVSLRPSPLILSRFLPELQAIIFVSALPSCLSATSHESLLLKYLSTYPTFAGHGETWYYPLQNYGHVSGSCIRSR